MESTNSSAFIETSATVPSKVTFFWYDYILFTSMLLFSVVIGLYFGFFGKKQTTTSEYLMGGKTMKAIPIAISLIASNTCGIDLLVIPVDVYGYGASYWLSCLSMILLCVVTIYVYLPVFFDLQMTSAYEYLERRFDNRTRLFASFLYVLSIFLFVPIVAYVPALAFSAATGISVNAVTPVVCGICIFYTTIGGLKAVVWTDTIQFSVIIGSMVTVFVLGLKSTGGFETVWNKAVDGGRLDIFDFDVDPTKRDSFWIMVIGYTVHLMGFISIGQNYLQKFLSVPTFRDSVKSLIYFVIGMIIINTVTVLTGLIIYAKYSDCDPFATKQVSRGDQLLPYYVMDVAKGIPGLSGLFIAGIFSASLSTISVCLNSLAATIYEDFLSKFLSPGITQKTATNILKLTVIITGVICTCLVFIIEHLGRIFPLIISFSGVTNGTMLGLFTIGILFPRANSKGAFYGAIGGIIVVASISFPAKYYQMLGLFDHSLKPISTTGCELLLNETISANTDYTTINRTLDETTNGPPTFQPNFIFRISFYYYSIIGAVVTIVLGLIISYMTNQNYPSVNKTLISPVSHFLLRKKTKTDDTIILYSRVDKPLQVAVKKSPREDDFQS